MTLAVRVLGSSGGALANNSSHTGMFQLSLYGFWEQRSPSVPGVSAHVLS